MDKRTLGTNSPPDPAPKIQPPKPPKFRDLRSLTMSSVRIPIVLGGAEWDDDGNEIPPFHPDNFILLLKPIVHSAWKDYFTNHGKTLDDAIAQVLYVFGNITRQLQGFDVEFEYDESYGIVTPWGPVYGDFKLIVVDIIAHILAQGGRVTGIFKRDENGERVQIFELDHNDFSPTTGGVKSYIEIDTVPITPDVVLDYMNTKVIGSRSTDEAEDSQMDFFTEVLVSAGLMDPASLVAELENNNAIDEEEADFFDSKGQTKTVTENSSEEPSKVVKPKVKPRAKSQSGRKKDTTG